MINIFRGTFSETINIRNLLKNMCIQVFTENENMANIEPWAISSGGFNPIILKVKVEDFENAKKLIEDFENGILNQETLKFPIGHFSKPDFITENDIQNWIETIEMFPSKLKNAAINLSIEELNYKYRPEGWKIKQVVHHCADSHMNSFIRFKLALTEDNPTIKPYDEAKWATLIDGDCDDISASLLILEGIHTRWTMLLKSFSASDLAKTFTHPESQKTYKIKEVIGLYAWHCNHHFAHIEQALLYKGKF